MSVSCRVPSCLNEQLAPQKASGSASINRSHHYGEAYFHPIAGSPSWSPPGLETYRPRGWPCSRPEKHGARERTPAETGQGSRLCLEATPGLGGDLSVGGRKDEMEFGWYGDHETEGQSCRDVLFFMFPLCDVLFPFFHLSLLSQFLVFSSLCVLVPGSAGCVRFFSRG